MRTPGRFVPAWLGPAAIVLCLAAAGRAPAGEAYYVLVFGSQRTPNEICYSHSFATFVRATWNAPPGCPCRPTIEAHTISWMPANLDVRPLALLPECGRNLGLYETLDYTRQIGARVSVWGPYRIDAGLYFNALRQKAYLESGCVQYKANDALYRSDYVSNCIHAVSTVAEGTRVRVLSPGWGETASYAVLQGYAPWVIGPEQVHPWVASMLGLNGYALIYRGWCPPRSGALVGPINRLLGGERCLAATYGPPGR
jgi:hypothetical protein